MVYILVIHVDKISILIKEKKNSFIVGQFPMQKTLIMVLK